MSIGSGSLNYASFLKSSSYDLIPVDINSNQVIAATAYKGFIFETQGREALKEVDIYHHSSSVTNPFTWDDY